MKIALVGNQNSGKTTLFNLLTGSNQKIGNWPGVTIECKVGQIKGSNHQLVDLPGIYSLSPYTLEEEISRKFIFEEEPDLIINIIDATSLERSLYLTTQLLELDVNVLVVLNMSDILEKKGLIIDEKILEEFLGVEVVKISALKRIGIVELINKINSGDIRPKRQINIFPDIIEKEIYELIPYIQSPHKRFIAIKLLEDDKNLVDLQFEEVSIARRLLGHIYEKDIESIIANERYRYIELVKSQAVTQIDIGETLTDKLDKIFLNKWLSIPIFAIVMFLIYFLAVGMVGGMTVEFIEGVVERVSEFTASGLEKLGASSWSISLVVDGIIAGVGAVLSFIPQLIILFLCISILETTGYMSRISFILDKIFRRFGLSGKTLIPFIVGAGCSVPGVLSTRTIEDEKERKMSIILTPFIPCSARLPVIVLFSTFFFGRYSGIVAASLYFLAIILIFISALILKKVINKGEQSPYITELPEYKAINLLHIAKDVFQKIWEFIKRAGSVILLCSIIIWFLVSFSWKFEYGVGVEKSILASIGNAIAWFFYPMLGEYSWAASVSAIQGLVAKEQVVSSMSVIAGLASDTVDGRQIFTSELFSFFNTPSALAYMAFVLFSAPCIGTIGAMKRELGSTKNVLLAVGFQTLLAWVVAVLIFGVGTLIGVIF